MLSARTVLSCPAPNTSIDPSRSLSPAPRPRVLPPPQRAVRPGRRRRGCWLAVWGLWRSGKSVQHSAVRSCTEPSVKPHRSAGAPGGSLYKHMGTKTLSWNNYCYIFGNKGYYFEPITSLLRRLAVFICFRLYYAFCAKVLDFALSQLVCLMAEHSGMLKIKLKMRFGFSERYTLTWVVSHLTWTPWRQRRRGVGSWRAGPCSWSWGSLVLCPHAPTTAQTLWATTTQYSRHCIPTTSSTTYMLHKHYSEIFTHTHTRTSQTHLLDHLYGKMQQLSF